MTENICRIICASAGTGKTFRLSLEYLTLILQFYGQPDFSLDCVLVLTFTRKATAEIRQRILSHLDLLTGNQDQEKKAELLQNLASLMPGRQSFTEQEMNLLLSAKNEIICDKSRLQVMTIDAYINHIFRNIVRPLRNIERYDIDTGAIKKQMPLLLNHLMKPIFREKLNKLLTRRLSRSMDDYGKLFASLISQRWLYYLITSRTLSNAPQTGTAKLCELATNSQAEAKLKDFHNSLSSLLEQVDELRRKKQDASLGAYFNAGFRKLCCNPDSSLAQLKQNILSLRPEKLENLLFALKDNIWNGNKLRKTSYPDETEFMLQAQSLARKNLADFLMEKLFLPEQQEILELWGIVLAEYDRLIYRNKKLGYDDISWLCFEALFSHEPPFMNPASSVSATEFYQFLSHRTRFLLIDEFQDTSLIQFNILKPIIEEITAGEGSKPFGGLIVVGDEKQSIFGWRGGERDLLLNLQTIFPAISTVQTERLEECWRCGPTLMQFINAVFQNPVIHGFLQDRQLSWSYPLIRSAEILKSEPGAKVELCLQNYGAKETESTNSKEAIAAFVKKMVKPALDADGSGSIAILCRKGSELTEIQLALDEAEISSLYQPDRSIVEHKLVIPLLAWLRFVAWSDWQDFVQFLRSDYVRLRTDSLKKVLLSIKASQENARNQCSEPDFSCLPQVADLLSQAKLHKAWSVSHICSSMTESYLPTGLAGQRDYLNLHHWLDLCAAWELNSGQNSIPDFLAYLKENAYSEDFKQISISGEDSLQLLTFHKAKGLQFKRVFVFYNLSGGHASEHGHLETVFQYAGKDYQYLQDYGLSNHYMNILKASSYNYLWNEAENREMLEEMNNLYVAFTRAEKMLHLYFCYRSSDPWPVYFEEKAKDKLPALVCHSALSGFSGIQPDADGIYRLVGPFQATEAKNEQDGGQKEMEKPQILPWKPLCLPAIEHYQQLDINELSPLEKASAPNWQPNLLHNKANLVGDLLHLYLSHIIRNTVSEHQMAEKRCVQRFGAIFPRATIDKLIERARQACKDNPWLFDGAWDRIFTEQDLYHQGKLLRMDRLMLCSSARKALIVDYKSGEIHDPNQLDTYAQALASMPAAQIYTIETRVLMV